MLSEFESHLFGGLLVGWWACFIVPHEQFLLLANATGEQVVTAAVAVASLARLPPDHQPIILNIRNPTILDLLEPVGGQDGMAIGPLLEVVRDHFVAAVVRDLEASR